MSGPTGSGFWDQFTRGYEKNMDEYREKKREERARTERKDAQELGLMTQLFQSGDVNAETYNQRLAKSGITGGTARVGGIPGVMPGADVPLPVVQKSKAQRRREILAQGPEAVSALSDAEREDLGFKTSTQQRIEAGEAAQADVIARKSQAITRFMSGEQLSDAEREVTGIMSASDRQMQQMAKLDPLLTDLGERYVADQVIQRGGEIPAGQAASIADAAFNKYIQERAQQFGTMVPEQVQAARTYFSRAVQNMLIAQKKAQIEDFNSRTARIGANAGATRAQQSQELQWFGKITGAVESLRKAQNDLMRSSPGLSAALGDPSLAQNPLMRDAVARYNQLEEQIEGFKGVQAGLANSEIPQNLQGALQMADQISQQGTVGAPVKAPVKPPAGGAPPQVNIQAAVDLLVSGKGTVQQLQQAVTAGVMTQEQANQIIQQANQKRNRVR